ncbi:MAG TPA: membrane-associated protein [Planctomycetota bacterium]|nr:membrane-associated protein [Planctomycetota bacterium]
MSPGRIPFWLKVAWTLWVGVWIPLYWKQWGPSTFLWFCDLANFLILAALWTESALLFSWQAVSVLLFQIAFTVDVAGRALLGRHLIGGTEWVFNDGKIPLYIKLLSVGMHLAAPPLLIWAVRKLGYDRRALLVQVATVCVLLPICWLGWDETLNLNWVYKPFNRPQTSMSPGLYLLVCIVGYTLLVFLPTHLLLARLFGRKETPAPAP